MFDIGWTELALIVIVTVLVVGPKELPGLLRTLGQMINRLRQMSAEFRSQIDQAIQAEEIKSLQKDIDDIQNNNPIQSVKDDLNKQLDTDLDSYLAQDFSQGTSQTADKPTDKPAEGTEKKPDTVVELQTDVQPSPSLNGTIENNKAREA